MVAILAQRCREPSWVRTSVASLQRFRTMTGYSDLEALREQALAEPAAGERALAAFADALGAYTESQVSALAMGAKLWFRLNGVTLPWRPLPGKADRVPLPETEPQGMEQVILLALIGSGLHLSELLRLRRGDVGELDADGFLIPDIQADPLAVQYTPRRGKQVERITFLTFQARRALLASLGQATAAGRSIDLTLPLIAHPDGSALSRSSVERARRRSRALIEIGTNVNVELCRATGDFFRSWGLPGSRFVGSEELNMEDYI
jgi:integrase